MRNRIELPVIYKYRQTFFKVSIILITLGILFDLVKKIFHIPLFFPGISLLIIYTIIYNPRVFLKKSVLACIALYIILLLYSGFNHFTDYPSVHLSPFGIFTIPYPLLISALLIENFLIFRTFNYDFQFKVGKMALLFIITMSALTILAEYIEPGISRRGGSFNASILVTALTFGGIYGLPFVFASIVSSYRGWNLSLLFLIIIVICLLMAGFLTAIIFTGFLTAISFLLRMKLKNPIYIAIAMSLLFVIGYNSLNTFIELLPKLPNEVYSQKTEDLNEIAEGDVSMENISIRENVYSVSINTFKKHPVFGSGEWFTTGEHSYILDRLAFLGIFGTFFFILALFLLFKRSLLLLSNPTAKLHYSYFIGSFFILLFLNPFYQIDFWIIVSTYVPLIINYLEYKNSEERFKQQQKKYLTTIN